MNRAARRVAQAIDRPKPQRIDLTGPTLAARVYTHTDEEPMQLAARLLGAAQGARVDLTTGKVSLLPDNARTKRLWEMVIEREGGGTIVPGYRSLMVELHTRTDDPFDVWGTRVRDAIWAPGELRLWLLELGQLEPADARRYWAEHMARTREGGLS